LNQINSIKHLNMFAATAITLVLSTGMHPERLAQVKAIDATPGLLWRTAKAGRFVNQAPGAFSPLLGVANHTQMVLELQAKTASGELEAYKPKMNLSDVPDAFDSATAFPNCIKTINDIRDQSMCGCCWAFGGAEAASDRMCIASKGALMYPLSAQDVCFCSNPNGCDGGMIDTPWSYISSNGVVTGGQFNGTGAFGSMCSDFSLPHCHHHGPQGFDPYPAEGTPGCEQQSSAQCPTTCGASYPTPFAQDKYTFSGSVQTAQGEAQIQQMIMEGGPVETAFTVYSDFENYAGGIYKHVSGQMAGGHAVKFVGWGVEGGVKYWKVANSWNPYWGENGYFRIIRGDSEGNGGIENMVTGSSADATWSKKSA